MRKFCFYFFLFLCFPACNKEYTNEPEIETKQTQNNIKTYYVVMSISLENQHAKLINERFERLNNKKFETIEHFVSDVREVT